MSNPPREKAQSHEFKAEIKQLLEILVHSVYTSRDIFIRELVSNAADALEKVRFSKVRGEELRDADAELQVSIETKQEDDKRLLIVSDTGIGMTIDEVRDNLGTIAHSGAKGFLEKLKEGDKSNLSLIGQFGVGFYSVFMAAEKVVITTRSADPNAAPVIWTSDGLGTYTVETLDEDAPRGTRIEVWLKESEKRFADKDTVTSAIARYSNFVPFPIVVDGERVNKATALWREPPAQVKKEQYNDLFKFLTHETQDPILRLHLSVDAPLQFAALLFVPETNPEIMGFGERDVSLQLYVKRVLIDPDNKDLLPRYLRFVKGVVESEDLPLNVSRETLQENSMVVKIRETITRKLLDRFLELAEKEPDEYEKFWKTFGRILKEGHSDFANREKFQELLRFNSSAHEDDKQLTSLRKYVEGMPAEQKAIYYLSGPGREALERDPRLEIFRKKRIEVLYLYEIADEFVLGGLGTYKEKPLVSADGVKPDDLKALGAADDDAKKRKDKRERKSGKEASRLEALIERFKDVLGSRVTDVRVSERLVDSAACLVSDEGALSPHMDKVFRLIHKDTELPKRTLELNPDHRLIKNLARLFEANRSDPLIDRAAEQIFEGAMLVDGYLTDPHLLLERMHETLSEATALKVEKT